METINGQAYYTAAEVAALTGRTRKTIYGLIARGNQLGKLPARSMAGIWLIGKKDLHEYRFVSSGRYGSMTVYRYDENFNKTFTDDAVSYRPSR